MRLVKVKTGSERKRSAGRPRSEASRIAILDAAYGFLQSKPVATISTVHIARKAGVSLSLIHI